MIVKVPYQRFEELLRAEIKLESMKDCNQVTVSIDDEPLETFGHNPGEPEPDITPENPQGDTQEMKTDNTDTNPSEGSDTAETPLKDPELVQAEQTLKHIITSIIENTNRLSNTFTLDDEVMAMVKNGKLNVATASVPYMSCDFDHSRGLNMLLEKTDMVHRQKNGKLTGPRKVTTYTGEKSVNVWIIKNHVLEELGIFDEVFKYNKMDADKLEYKRRF